LRNERLPLRLHRSWSGAHWKLVIKTEGGQVEDGPVSTTESVSLVKHRVRRGEGERWREGEGMRVGLGVKRGGGGTAERVVGLFGVDVEWGVSYTCS